ncbi:MAG: hypothetical protein EZS28_008398 [Streblomastix strix]|uniref:N-end aminoacyl transferase N-terminal domain-containing protein n=1 Tax=Streblomastix strix TaxID=222440 RepID=A0A5J4WNT3_9EUKA|nr:MAG: hypothetical protein EZS28_008398 [Streblomastix strix]
MHTILLHPEDNIEPMHDCGYCHKQSEITISSFTISGQEMDAEDYEELINRGFRRSGMYCYTYYPWFNCCPGFAIRADALRYNFSSTNHRDFRRWRLANK